MVLWVPPLIDQLGNDPGNIRTLLDHFDDPPEAVLGLADGTRLALRHLDVWAGFAGFTGNLEGAGRFVSPAEPWRGAVTLVVWLVTAVIAWRRGPSSLRHLHVVIAAALLLGLISMTRIFGLPWFYLTLWAWGTTTLALGAAVWTCLALWRGVRGSDAAEFALPALSIVVLTVATLTSVVTSAGAEVPEERLSRAIGALAPATYEAIADGVGAATGLDGSYQVRWSDAADIGSPGFGLLNELERQGLDVAADEYFYVPATAHRVRPREQADAQVHLATGGYVDRWRQVPGSVEVATYEPRTAEQIARAEAVRARLITRLGDEGLDDVAEQVDTNLFGASLDTRVSADDLADITELLDLGQPMAVFVAAPDAEAGGGWSPPGLSRSVNPARMFPICIAPCPVSNTSVERFSVSVQRSLSLSKYEISGSPADHHRRRIGVDGDNRRHDRSVCHTKPRRPDDTKVRSQDRIWRRTHLATAGWMEPRTHVIGDESGDLSIGLDGRSRKILAGRPLGERRRRGDHATLSAQLQPARPCPLAP